VFGGFINTYLSWRWSFWVLAIWAGCNWLLIAFFVPETYSPVLLRRKAVKLRKESGDEIWKAPIEMMDRSVVRTVLWSCVRPFQLLVFEQMCLSLCLLSAILLGILYLFFGVSALHCMLQDVDWTNSYRHLLWCFTTTTDSICGSKVSMW
jgi:MFS family permease